MRRDVQRFRRAVQRSQPVVPADGELRTHRRVVVRLVYTRQQPPGIALMPPEPVDTVVQLGGAGSHRGVRRRLVVFPRPRVVTVLLVLLALARRRASYRLLQFRVDHAARVRAVRALQAHALVLRSGGRLSPRAVAVVAGLVRADVVRGEPLLAARRRISPVVPQRGHHVQVHVQRGRLGESRLVDPSRKVHSVLSTLERCCRVLNARVTTQRHRAAVVRAVATCVLLLEVVIDPLQVTGCQSESSVLARTSSRTLSKLRVRASSRFRDERSRLLLRFARAPSAHQVPVPGSSPSQRRRSRVRLLDLQSREVFFGRGFEQPFVLRGERAVTFLGQNGELRSQESVRKARLFCLLEVAAAALAHR